MPQKGGKKTKRVKKVSAAENDRHVPTADKSDGQCYAIATKMLGNRRLMVKCMDGSERMAHIPGKFKGRRHFINEGMLLMLNLRAYQDERADVVYIYKPQETRKLHKQGELVGLMDEIADDQDGFDFLPDEEEDDRLAQEPAAQLADYDLPESDDEDFDNL